MSSPYSGVNQISATISGGGTKFLRKRFACDLAFAAVASAAHEIMPKVRAGELLPVDSLEALNAAIQNSEARYGTCLKSDVIPEQLLASAHGSKLYGNLLKKVETLCGRLS